MFTGFPLLSTKLLDTLSKQHFRYFVKQYYGAVGDKFYFLYSPFKEDYKALHYFERLPSTQSAEYFDLSMEASRAQLYHKATEPAGMNSYVKIIEHNFKLDDNTRNKIAVFISQKYPQHYEWMIKNNFRIVIGDNFGDVFYNVRIGQGVLLPVKESDLEKLSNYVP